MRPLLRRLPAPLAWAMLWAIAVAVPVAAAPGVTITLQSDPHLYLDSNRPCTDGPRASYVQFRIRNTTGSPVLGAAATLSGLSNGFTLAGGQPAAIYLGAIPAGGYVDAYWFMATSCTIGNSTTVQVSVTDNTSGATTGSATLTATSSISSQAGGNLSSNVLGAGAVVGQTITMDATYSFGGVAIGDTYSFQPAGTTTFNAACFQLLGSEVRASDTPGNVPVGALNQIYFVANGKDTGTKISVTMRYNFKYLCGAVTSVALPYAEQTSGTQMKYSGNFDATGGGGEPFPTPQPIGNSFTLATAVTPTLMSTGGTVTDTVRITNTSSWSSYVDSIRVTLPTNVTYVGIAAGSDVTVANSSVTPPGGGSGTLFFKGNPGTTYSLPAGATLRLIFTVNVPSAAGSYDLVATGYAGLEQLGTGTATVRVGAELIATVTGPATAGVGDTVRYITTVRNDGPAPATAVVTRAVIPAGLTPVRSSRGGSFASGAVTWPALATLAAGAGVTDTVVLVAATQGSWTGVFSASASSTDGIPANNDGSAGAARVTTVVGTIALAIAAPATPVPQLPGTAYNLTFRVRNTGAGTETIDLTSSLVQAGAVLKLRSIAGSGLTVADSAHAQVTLPAGDSVAVIIGYDILMGDSAQATVRLTGTVPAFPSSAQTASVVITREVPNISITRTVSPSGTVLPGTSLTYTIALVNVGQQPAHTVLFTEAVSTHLAFRVGSPTISLPGGVTAALVYSHLGSGYAPVSGGCGAAAGFDACVDGISWTLTGNVGVGGSVTVTYGAIVK